MNKSKILVAVIIIILVVAGVYGLVHKSNNNNSPAGSSTSSNSTASSSQTTGTINIRDMMFTPSQITIAKGGTVTWTNNDSVTHTVIDDLGSANGPHSGDIAPGSSYSFTFNSTGSFQYHCSIHPSMRGTIVVK